jgi:hypothetical protein
MLAAAVPATGAERGTPAEAQAMLTKAVAHYTLGKALWDAGSKSEGSVRYEWLNPVSAQDRAQGQLRPEGG